MLGAGALARTIADCLPAGTELFWAVSREYLDPADDRYIDISSPSEADRECSVICAVGAPGLRRALVNTWPGSNFTSVVSPTAYFGSDCTVGAGVLVAPCVALSSEVTLGDHSLVHMNAVVGHDVRVGNFASVGPGSTIVGSAVIGDGVLIGAGATVVNSAVLAPGVIVGAGAAVVGDVPTPNAIVVGVPAKVVRVAEDWLNAY